MNRAASFRFHGWICWSLLACSCIALAAAYYHVDAQFREKLAIWIVLYTPSLLLLYGLFVLLRKRNRPRWAAALGWLALWTLPALGYQLAWTAFDWPDALRAAPIGLWVLLGGRTVIEVFEATARDLTGHRDSYMMDNVHVYLALTAIQCALFVVILARRDRRRLDPVAFAIGVAFLVNATLAAHWPWWGT